MSKRALVIRAEGNSHVLEFSPQDLRDVISDVIRTDDVIGIFFLDRLSEYPERDRPRHGEGDRMLKHPAYPDGSPLRGLALAEPASAGDGFGKGVRGLGRGRG
jgi:hypothetical protein